MKLEIPFQVDEVFSYFFGWVGGWVVGVGWLGKSDIKLISTQVVVAVEVGVELGNMFIVSIFFRTTQI